MSTPTPAKNESGAFRRSAFSWTFPGSPIRIDISLDVISRLRAELEQRENLASSSCAAEIGGVLLGHQKTPTLLEINDYVWVSSEEQPDSRYQLNPSQLKHLRFVYTIVGFFRTQPKDNLGLRDEEISFVGKHFCNPTDVVLLIQTSPHRYAAGFFFWMREGVFAPVSFMDFPLDAELLGLRIDSASTDAGVTQSTEEVERTTASDDQDAPALLGIKSASNEEPISKPAGYVRIGLRWMSYLERLWARHWISIGAESPLMQAEPAETRPRRTGGTWQKMPAGALPTNADS